jgi:predicted secreted hydrolase
MVKHMSRLPCLLLLSLLPASSPAVEPWRQALPGWDYQFPRDHFTHPDFRTEWWYATGRVRTAEGRRFGYQFTIFRRGVRPPADRAPVASRWVVDHLPLGHFALTDLQEKRFYYAQRLERGAFGRAGFGQAASTENRLAWAGDWQIALQPDQTLQLRANQPGAALDLTLTPARPPLIHGLNGVSQKSAGTGQASHYYSLTRMPTAGTVTVQGIAERVTGFSWFDREWATNQLAPDQIGWDWLSLHLSDGSDLMLYQLRRKDGTADPFSSGTLLAADGTPRHLTQADFTMIPVPGRTWTSAKSGGTYPISWQLSIPSLPLDLTIAALLPDQELALNPVAYWEGAIDAAGTRAGQPVKAEGYLEMTGYSGPLHALKQ